MTEAAPTPSPFAPPVEAAPLPRRGPAQLSRRGLTLVLAAVLALALTASTAVATVPYVALGAGPTYDTLGEIGGTPLISISGRRTYPTTGRLDLTTVSVRSELTLAEAMRGWVDDELAVVPRDLVYDPDETPEQIEQENTETMQRSQDAATSAALRALEIPFATVRVASVADGAPAEGRLRVGDVLRSVDGQVVDGVGELVRLVSGREPGAAVELGVERGGQAQTVQLTTTRAAGQDGQPDRAVVGVETEEQVDYPFEVEIQLEDVGGPSAGLMFALGIVDKLDPQQLTGGRYVAGTGEISPDGAVGPIGGIPQKLLGARRKGATAFLTPAGNCAEAAGVRPDGLTLVRVETLRDALVGLRVLRDGGTPRTCTTDG